MADCIYQPPAERNALGRIRFNFPNRFLVYQHDTPDKFLFRARPSAPTVMAACAWRIPTNMPRYCCRWSSQRTAIAPG